MKIELSIKTGKGIKNTTERDLNSLVTKIVLFIDSFERLLKRKKVAKNLILIEPKCLPDGMTFTYVTNGNIERKSKSRS